LSVLILGRVSVVGRGLCSGPCRGMRLGGFLEEVMRRRGKLFGL
jgi:hypothetical protein